MGKLLSKLWGDERGQSTTEYILILSVVVMVAMKFRSTFGEKLKTIVDQLGAKMTDAVNDTNAP